MWIGYGGAGLGRLKDGRFSHCRMAQGLHDDYLSNMIPDGRGRLWFAGNQGIFSVRETEAFELAEGRIARVRSVAYGQTEGLSRLQASHGIRPSFPTLAILAAFPAGIEQVGPELVEMAGEASGLHGQLVFQPPGWFDRTQGQRHEVRLAQFDGLVGIGVRG